MKSAEMLLFTAVVAFTACTPGKRQTSMIDITSVGESFAAFPAPSVDILRVCSVHKEVFSYAIIRRVTSTEAFDWSREAKEEAIIKGLAESAPNAISIPNILIISSRVLPSEEKPNQGFSERVFEFCPKCEEIKQEALKR